jgi:succinate dehydrogenase / fumarate reductase, cytochrome b subunit
VAAPTTVRQHDVPAPTRPAASSATLKVVMAVTGVVFIAYVFAHMLGNLKVFLGKEDMNHYAAFLRELLVPLLPHEWALWGFRIVLLVCLVAHVGAAAVLTVRRRAAGGQRATRGRRVPWWRSFTSRTMAVSGVVILAFLIFHLLDLTFGTLGGEGFRHPETVGGETHYYAYENLVASFQRPAVAIWYVLAMVVLTGHLLHGAWSVIHDFGVTGARARQVLWTAGTVVAAAVLIGNIAIPLSVMVGWVE